MAKNIKRTVKSVQKDAEIALDKIGAQLEDVLRGSKNDKRDYIEKTTKTAISDFEDHTKEMSKDHLPAVQRWLTQMEKQSISQGTKGRLDTSTIRKAYNMIKEIVDGKGSGKQVSHQGSGILTAQLYIMYIRLNELASSDVWGANTQKRQMYGSSGQHAKIPKSDIAKGQTEIANIKPRDRWVSQQDTQVLAENIRKLWITAKAVSEMDIDGFSGNSMDDLDKALDEYFRDLDQEQHLINKENEVNIITGDINQKIKVEIQTKRSNAEELIGTAKNESFDKLEATSLKKVLNNYKQNFANIKGSKAVVAEVMRQLTESALGKKPRPYKSNSPPLKLRKRKSKPLSSSKRLKKSITASGKLKMPPLAARVMHETGSDPEDQVSVLKLKSLINKRLPAEVRRNMGRPALINRTGRFSNSIEVLRLKDTPQGISGDYTYRLNPYQTFENTGSKRWPMGYNPKTLITKSIRQLAMQYTEQKLTILRRR